VQLLGALDAEPEREGGDGVQGTDQCGIHTAGLSSSDTSLGAVCVSHPRITGDAVLRGADGLDDETERRLDAHACSTASASRHAVSPSLERGAVSRRVQLRRSDTAVLFHRESPGVESTADITRRWRSRS
jgi:hypothetical protein